MTKTQLETDFSEHLSEITPRKEVRACGKIRNFSASSLVRLAPIPPAIPQLVWVRAGQGRT